MSQPLAPPLLPCLDTYRTRYIQRRDLRDVLAIDAASFVQAWDAAALRRLFRQPDVNGRVTLVDERVAGFLVYRWLTRGRVHIERFAVAPGFRHYGIGARMARGLVERFVGHHGVRLTLHVRERNDDGIAFWRACGFRATGIRRDHYQDGQDAYTFEYIDTDLECEGR